MTVNEQDARKELDFFRAFDYYKITIQDSLLNAGKSIQRIRSVSDNFQWTCYQRLRGGDVRTHRQSDRRRIEYGKDV